MKIFIFSFFLVAATAGKASAQFTDPIVTAAVEGLTAVTIANHAENLTLHAQERLADETEKAAAKAKEQENWINQLLNDDKQLQNLSAQLDALNQQIGILTTTASSIKTLENNVLSLSVVPAIVLESTKLAEIFNLVDQTKATCASGRVTSQALFSITDTTKGIRQGQPVFSAEEQLDIGSVLDRYLYNIRWRLVDLSQFVIIGGSSQVTMSDRFKLIGMIYDDIYKNYQDSQRYNMNLRQANRFRSLVGISGGGATILRF